MTTDPGFIREAAMAIFAVEEAQRFGVTFVIEGSRLAISFPLDIDPVILGSLQSAINDKAQMIGRFIKTRAEGLL